MEKTHISYSRRALFRQAAIVAGGGAIGVAGLVQGSASAQAGKVAQSTAKYQATPKGDAQCNTCVSFIAPSSCKLVAGTVSPSGWCAFYSKKA